MKRVLLFVAFLSFSIVAMHAEPRAIGANFGGSVDFSYQHSLKSKNMLDFTVGFPYIGDFGLSGSVTYDWINPNGAKINWDEDGEWNWYLGLGGAVGVSAFEDPYLMVGLAAHAGIEYSFEIPLILSVDYRPIFGGAIGDGYYAPGLFHLSIGVKYRFH